MRKASHGKWIFFEIVCALLLLTLLLTTVIREGRHSYQTLSFEKADLVHYTEADDLYGYVFRTEETVSATNRGPVFYQVENGAYVSARQPLADVYRDDTNDNKRERAAQLQAEIAQLEAALAVGNSWQSAYTVPYGNLMRDLSKGKLQNAADAAAETATALGGRHASSAEHSAAVLQQIDTLKMQLNELIRHINDPYSVPATREGIFYHAADGYEAAFSVTAVEALTPDTLEALLAEPQADAGVIGKVVDRGAWYLAVPTTPEVANSYREQQIYTVRFSNGTQKMLLTKIVQDGDENRALLILSAEKMPDFALDGRLQSITLEKQGVTGLSVPTSAVIDGYYVFVLGKDGAAHLKKITPILQKNGVLLVQPKSTEDELNENDIIILNTDKVYDGKVLS